MAPSGAAKQQLAYAGSPANRWRIDDIFAPRGRIPMEEGRCPIGPGSPRYGIIISPWLMRTASIVTGRGLQMRSWPLPAYYGGLHDKTLPRTCIAEFPACGLRHHRCFAAEKIKERRM
jgi:hypothetical protein